MKASILEFSNGDTLISLNEFVHAGHVKYKIRGYKT